VLHDYWEWIERYKRAHFGFFAERGWLTRSYMVSQGYEGEPAALDQEETDLLTSLAGELEDDWDDDDDDDDNSSSGEEEDDQVADDPFAVAAVESPRGEAGLKFRQMRERRRIRAIESAWKNGVWGWCESRLQYLANAYVVFAFNAEAFDLVLLCSRLVTYAKESGRSDVKFHRDGNKIRWLTMGGLRLAEIKRLLGAGTSLKKMSRTCGLELEKALFPFDLLTSVDYLKESELPPDKASWVTSLAPEAGPSQQEVDEARAVFARKGFANVGQYLDYYLGLDVTILLRCAVIMKRQYYQILGLDYIDSRKFTVSSLSALGAQMFLARRKRPGHFFPNHARMYSVSVFFFPGVLAPPLFARVLQLLKASLRGGLTAVYRSFAGEATDVSSHVALLERQLAEEPEGEAAACLARSGKTSLEDYLRGCNAHLLPDSEPARYAMYLDINSLYATSCECRLTTCALLPAPKRGQGQVGPPLF
jgi:hypothetical protein